MESIEIDGRNVEDAVSRGLVELGLTRDEVEVEVLEAGSGAFFGLFGRRRARVRLRPNPDVRDEIARIVEHLLRAMQVRFQLTVERKDGVYEVSVVTVGADGLLIGRKGDTLSALQHLVDRMVNRQRAERIRVSLDIGGYRQRRTDALRNRALAMASQVKATGREKTTDPLHPPDRRIVHLALSGDPAIRTYTVGDGTYRSVVVAPADSRSKPAGAKRTEGSYASAVARPAGEDEEEDL